MKGVPTVLSGLGLFARVHYCQAESAAAVPGISSTFLTPKQKFFSLETEAETVWWEGGEIPMVGR